MKTKILLASALFLCGALSAQTNFIKNGSFEEGKWDYETGAGQAVEGAPKYWNMMGGGWDVQSPVTSVYLLSKTADRATQVAQLASQNVAWCENVPLTTNLLTPPDGNVIAVVGNAFLMQNVVLPAGTYTFSGKYMRYSYGPSVPGTGSGIYIYYLDGETKVYTAADVNLVAGETTLNMNGKGSEGTTMFNYWDSFSKDFTLTAETTVTVQIDMPGAHPGPWVGGQYAVDNLKLVSKTTAVENVKTSNLIIRSGNNKLFIHSPSETSANIYNSIGAKVKELKLQIGENTVSGLQKGIYIVDGQKVVIR